MIALYHDYSKVESDAASVNNKHAMKHNYIRITIIIIMIIIVGYNGLYSCEMHWIERLKRTSVLYQYPRQHTEHTFQCSSMNGQMKKKKKHNNNRRRQQFTYLFHYIAASAPPDTLQTNVPQHSRSRAPCTAEQIFLSLSVCLSPCLSLPLCKCYRNLLVF